MPTIGHWSIAELQTRLDALTEAAENAGRAESTALEPQISNLLDDTRAELSRDTDATAQATTTYKQTFGWGRRHNPFDGEAHSHFQAHVQPARREVKGDERLIDQVAALQDRVATEATTVGTMNGSANGLRYSARVLELSSSHYEVRGTQNGHRIQFDAVHADDQIILKGTHNGSAFNLRITKEESGSLRAEGSHNGYRFSFDMKRSTAGACSIDGTHNGHRISLKSKPVENGTDITGTHNNNQLNLSIRSDEHGALDISGSLNGYAAQAAYAGGKMTGSLNGHDIRTSTSRNVDSALGNRLLDSIALPFPIFQGDSGDALQVALWAVLSDRKKKRD